MATTDLPVLINLLIFTALVFIIMQNVAVFTTAFLAAPSEILTFIDIINCSGEEHESYHDLTKVQRVEDKIRVGKLLREIQRISDDLREDIHRLLVDESEERTVRLRTRLVWATKRKGLEAQISRLDMVKMRLLVVYIRSLMAPIEPTSKYSKDPERLHTPKMTLRPSLPQKAEVIARKAPLPRRITTQAIGHYNDAVETPSRSGWAGVVAELQKSPLMHKRHASIESSSPL